MSNRSRSGRKSLPPVERNAAGQFRPGCSGNPSGRPKKTPEEETAVRMMKAATPEEMDEIGYEDCFYGEGVTLVEWADLVRDILPEETIYITIEPEPGKDPDHRKITIVKNDEDNSH